MRSAKNRWLGLAACAAVFFAGLICLLLALHPQGGGSVSLQIGDVTLIPGDAATVNLQVRDLTVTPAASPDRPDDWRDWYEVRYILENQSDRSLPLSSYDLVYTAGGDTLYPWDDGSSPVLAARPVLPAGREVEVCHLLYLEEGESARVSLRYDSWAETSDLLAEFTLGE